MKGDRGVDEVVVCMIEAGRFAGSWDGAREQPCGGARDGSSVHGSKFN